jgi:hypothetical protein
MKLFHVILAVLFTVLVFSGIVPSTFFSKEAIIDNMIIGATMSDIELLPADMLHVARMLRREMWDFHAYIGFAFYASVFVYLVIAVKNHWSFYNNAMKIYIGMFALTITFQFTTGVILWARQFIETLVAYKEIVMHAHFLSSFMFIGILLLHVAERIYKASKK